MDTLPAETAPTEAGAIAALAVAAAGAPSLVTTPEGRQFLVTPEGVDFKDVTEPNAIAPRAPALIGEAVTIQTADSLVDYINRFKTPDTILFANIDANSIVAAIDWHGPAAPSLVKHHAGLHLPFSFEWKTWTAISGKLMPQLEFARFLEENAGDVTVPSGAELLEACRDLQALRRVDFKKAVRTDSDNENFEYTEETEARSRNGGVELPTKFKLEIPVYFGDPATSLYAFLRWRLEEGTLLLGVQLHRHEHVRQAVFKDHVRDIATATDRLAVFGRE